MSDTLAAGVAPPASLTVIEEPAGLHCGEGLDNEASLVTTTAVTVNETLIGPAAE